MKWKIPPRKSQDLIEQLLLNRGIESKAEREKFFNPKLEDYEKDLEIPGIERANKRILQAIEKEELIVVFGDYDVDGICASAILYKSLTSLGAKVLPYIPHREKEGYGLSKVGLEFAKDNGARLVITVDNGIVAFEQAKYAKEIGLDLIITDHHIPEKEKPEAYGIVHSTKMCGAAVAWCLVRDLIKKELSEELLQFVAIATVCDLVPLLCLNRAVVFEGLKVLGKTANPGLLALINESGVTGDIGSYEIGFMIGPRLNAMGRLQEKKIHILASKDWSAGIIGLVAGKICEEHFRPAIAISIGEEISKGSARSINGINIVEVIREHLDILIDVGGHPGAAGFSLLSKNIEVFKKKLESRIIDLPESERILEIDAEVATKQLTKSLVSGLQKFEPFGMNNRKPVFATRNMKVSDIRTVGNGKHLKFKVDFLDAIAFGMGGQVDLLRSAQTADLAFTLELDTYNGNNKLQLKIKDIRSDLCGH
ncbi:DHH family phosphoesterase [Candidatus Daviesbacteria bacterium]|nr:DHH family phosphoesterase [Candidatus Daviesbacteria bacterium]